MSLTAEQQKDLVKVTYHLITLCEDSSKIVLGDSAKRSLANDIISKIKSYFRELVRKRKTDEINKAIADFNKAISKISGPSGQAKGK